MTLEDICMNRTPGKTMTAHNWYSRCWSDDERSPIVSIYHHGTQMLEFVARSRRPYFPILVRNISHVDFGWGSKSDEKGMNRIFKKLGIPWYYSRRAGIINLVTDPKHKSIPKYMRDPETRKNIYGYAA